MGSANYNQLRELLVLHPAIEHVRVRRPWTETPGLIAIAFANIAVAARKKEFMLFARGMLVSSIMIIEFVDLHRSLREASETRLDKRIHETSVNGGLLVLVHSAGDQRGRHFRW